MGESMVPIRQRTLDEPAICARDLDAIWNDINTLKCKMADQFHLQQGRCSSSHLLNPFQSLQVGTFAQTAGAHYECQNFHHEVLEMRKVLFGSDLSGVSE